jgi:hypothetical protein
MTFSVTNGKKTVTFIHIPKTGGTSIHKWFRTMCEYEPNGYTFNSFGTHNSHFGMVEVLNRTDDVGYSFAVVRNPYDYIVSLYRFFISVFPKWQVLRPELDWGFDTSWIKQDLTFTEFVEKLEEWPTPLPKGYTFASPQTEYLYPKVDKILRYENLVDDFAIIQNCVQFYLPLGHHNKSDRGHYKDYYNDHLKSLVTHYFELDIDRFGYTYV